MPERRVAVNVSELSNPGWIWLGGRFSEDPFRWIGITGEPSSALEKKVQRPKLSAYRAAWQTAWAAKRHDAALIVSHGPRISAWTSLFCRALGVRATHLAFSFTFEELPTGTRRTLFTNAYRDIDRFVCFSSVECRRYSEYFDIPVDRIDSLHWAVAEAGYDSSAKPIEEPPYLCAVGGIGRDYRTLIDAMRLLPDRRLAIVARPANVEGIDLPSNVEVRTNIPLEDVWNITANAKLMVLPILDSLVPCGHGTLIMAMQLRVPSIVTQSTGMTDYVEDEVTGLVCPPADPEAMATCIERLWNDQALAERLIANGRKFAIEECSEERTVTYFTDYLKHLRLL